jgi:hypothetical protein
MKNGREDLPSLPLDLSTGVLIYASISHEPLITQPLEAKALASPLATLSRFHYRQHPQ